MLEKIKKIRELTGAGMVDIKKALQESAGDETKALDLLKKRGLEKAGKKADRQAKEGVIGMYIHTNGKVSSMVKLYCETDFVARNEEFKNLAKDIAMHIVAMNPLVLAPEAVSQDLIEQKKQEWQKELQEQKKPAEIIENILKGKEEKFRNEVALISQPFVKDPEMTVGDLVKQKISKIGENIQIGEFYRMEL